MFLLQLPSFRRAAVVNDYCCYCGILSAVVIVIMLGYVIRLVLCNTSLLSLLFGQYVVTG